MNIDMNSDINKNDNTQCYYKNKKRNYFQLIKSLLNPDYLSNKVNILFLVFLFCKNGFLIHSIIPLLITNGIFILYYLIFHFKGFKKENLLHTCGSNEKEDLFKDLTKISSNNKIIIYIISCIIHFYPIIIYKLLFRYREGFRFIVDKSKSNIMSSLFFNIILLLIYGLIMRKNQYSIVNIKDENILKIMITQFIPMLLTNTYLYFKLK